MHKSGRPRRNGILTGADQPLAPEKVTADCATNLVVDRISSAVTVKGMFQRGMRILPNCRGE
jgi:hypothetical protein